MPDQPRQINPWLIAVSVMFATFMEVLDTTVVNVSLPHIAGSLSVTIDEATWALTSYLVANAIILPMTGWLASMFGRKRLLMLSVVGFTMASFLCGLAPTLPLLILFRVIQGATGGALQPLSQGVLHQHPGGPRVDHHDAPVHFRSAVPARRIANNRLLGHRHARGRHRRAANRPRQGAGRRLVRIVD